VRLARAIAVLGLLIPLWFSGALPSAQADTPSGQRASGRKWFWKLVNEARAGGTSDAAFIGHLAARLGKLAPAEIAEFDRHFYELHRGSYRWDLWGACYLMRAGCSDDSFEYFRAWLMSQGQSVFERATRDPDSLAELPRGGELEELMQLPRQLYRDKTGKKLPYPPAGAASVPMNPVGSEWDFEDHTANKAHLPRLWARYGRKL
jgi:Protein of unknown function (DUF4240)